MQYFFDTVETIPDGLGFSLFSPLHIAWLIILAVTAVVCSAHYRRLDEKSRGVWRKTVAALLIANEVFKQICLIAAGNWIGDYLPLHLCSINIISIAYHAFRPSNGLGNFLYTVCIPGALAALLFPSWTALPLLNFMHLHSTTVHILLVLYPLVLTAGGDIRPEAKKIPMCLLILAVMAAVIVPVNSLLGTNFFFLEHADPGNPLYFFEQAFGSHLLGFPVIIAGVLLVMHLPWGLARKLKKTKTA